jgi:hypothetical protein
MTTSLVSIAYRLGFCFAVVITVASLTNAQPRNPASADIRQRNGKTVMVAVSNLDEDAGDCVTRHYSGTIIKVHHDAEYGIQIDGFTLLGPRGERNYFNVDQSIYEDFRLPRSDIGWLPTLIATNSKVRVDAHLCGVSGGVAIAQNIISAGAPSINAKSRRRHQHSGYIKQYSLAQRKRHPDRVKETKTIEGRFVNFEVGDYIHAMIKKPDGQTISFFLIKPGMEYFLVLHKNEPLTLTYQIVDTYIPEAGGMETIKRLISAKAANLTYAVWWKNIRTRFRMAQLQEKYDPLVQESTVEP